MNPPPNWPALPSDWRPADGWTPDPHWGPAPVGWTLWQRERRGAWLFRHKAVLGLGAGALVILGTALAGPAATQLVTAAPPLNGSPASSPEGPDPLPPVPGTEVRAEPQVDEPVRRPQQSTPVSRSKTRPSDEPVAARDEATAAPTPTAVPGLPELNVPVPELRAPALPGFGCDATAEPTRPPGDGQWRDRRTQDRQDVVLTAADRGDGGDGAEREWLPGDASCPAPTTPEAQVHPG